MKNKSVIIVGIIYMLIAITFFAINQFVYEFSYFTRSIFVAGMISIAIIFNIIKYYKKTKSVK